MASPFAFTGAILRVMVDTSAQTFEQPREVRDGSTAPGRSISKR
jgi:hypothetical protein